MPSTTMQGEGFGRHAGEATLRKATTEAELKRLVAGFQIILETTVALRRSEQGEEIASTFDHAARAAFAKCIARYADQSSPYPQPRC